MIISNAYILINLPASSFKPAKGTFADLKVEGATLGEEEKERVRKMKKEREKMRGREREKWEVEREKGNPK